MSNDGLIYVHHAGMDSLRDRLLAEMKAMQTNLDNMGGEIQKTINGAEWQGGFNDMFQQTKAKWDEVFESMGLMLNTHAQLVEDAKGNFIAADNRGAASFEGIV